MNANLVLLASLVLTSAAATAAADVTRTVYQIHPGGEYTYKPSPEGQGIPGGVPNAFQLDFGIGGTFVYELDFAGPSARLLNLNLQLTGNEAIQAAPPVFATVTADRVEEYLASHTFVEDFIGGLLHLESSTHEGLKLTDGLNGNLAISGGVDATPVDGDGLFFNFGAFALPDVPGDTNADLIVDLEDLNNVRNNPGGAGLGDTFPFDGDVDLDDLNAVRNNFGATAGSSAVPEPSGMALLSAFILAVAAQRIGARITTRKTRTDRRAPRSGIQATPRSVSFSTPHHS